MDRLQAAMARLARAVQPTLYSADSMGYRQPVGYDDSFDAYEPEQVRGAAGSVSPEQEHQATAPAYRPQVQHRPDRMGFGSTGRNMRNANTMARIRANAVEGYARYADPELQYAHLNDQENEDNSPESHSRRAEDQSRSTFSGFNSGNRGYRPPNYPKGGGRYPESWQHRDRAPDSDHDEDGPHKNDYEGEMDYGPSRFNPPLRGHVRPGAEHLPDPSIRLPQHASGDFGYTQAQERAFYPPVPENPGHSL